MADPPFRLCEEALERLASFHDEGVVAPLDRLVDGREQRALRDKKKMSYLVTSYMFFWSSGLFGWTDALRRPRAARRGDGANETCEKDTGKQKKTLKKPVPPTDEDTVMAM